MLMLVVVIIVAAVVSGFAGGLIGSGNENAPVLSMDVNVYNTGSFAGSGFFATVTGVSEPIATKDLKIVTSWTAANHDMPLSGGNTTLPGSQNINILFDPTVTLTGHYVAPFGSGPGVNASRGVTSGPTYRAFSEPRQQFGNYSLVAGTVLSAFPCGALDADSVSGNTPAAAGYGIGGRYSYNYTSAGAGSFTDAATAILGSGWERLRAGDKVNVKVILIPTGKVIFDKTVPVREG
jgi:uncharacterized membrane protein